MTGLGEGGAGLLNDCFGGSHMCMFHRALQQSQSVHHHAAVRPPASPHSLLLPCSCRSQEAPAPITQGLCRRRVGMQGVIPRVEAGMELQSMGLHGTGWGAWPRPTVMTQLMWHAWHRALAARQLCA